MFSLTNELEAELDPAADSEALSQLQFESKLVRSISGASLHKTRCCLCHRGPIVDRPADNHSLMKGEVDNDHPHGAGYRFLSLLERRLEANTLMVDSAIEGGG